MVGALLVGAERMMAGIHRAARESRFVAELPKNHYGKVLKTALREQLQKESLS